jgi:hypothetical protein
VTRSIETPESVALVLDALCDPRSIPEWAPAFADRIDGGPSSEWVATRDGRSFSVRMAHHRDAGTVDYLREIAPGQEGGAYLRVLPRPGGGAAIVMTLTLGGEGDAEAVSGTIQAELAALVSLLDRR